MKQKFKLFGIIALLAIIGSLMAACGGDDNPAHKCSFSNWTETTEPTCISKGIDTGTCSCGLTSTRDGAAINPNAHTFSTTPATCTTASIPGNCTRSGCTQLDPEGVISALGHFFNNRKCAELCFDFGMVLVEKGTFTMGPDIWNNNATVQVTFTKDFHMSKYLVTQELYEEIVGTNPSSFHGGDGREPEAGEVQGRRPVERITWFDTLDFCNKLSEAEGLEAVYTLTNITTAESGGITRITGATVAEDFSKNGYRLPTDAQWEYAARGGNGSPGNFTYSGSNDINEVAWYWDNSNSKTREVGKKAPNGLGIYDMSGNVWEWCWDWYGNYPGEPVTDYTGAVSGGLRVGRGGGWGSSAGYSQSVSRGSSSPGDRYDDLGFRLVRP